VEESIFYSGVNDEARKQESQDAGYHHLAESEADPEDAKDMEEGSFVTMGRHELARRGGPRKEAAPST
jgi:hypothetical protein